MDLKKCSVACWNVGGLGGKHHKYIVRNWIRSLPTPPWVVGLQELKASPFISAVALNTIAPDYPRIISKVDNGKGGTALLYHPSLTLVSSGILSHGRAVWAQLKLDSLILYIAVTYAPSDSARARALLWHQLKGSLPDGQWIICRDFNMTESLLDSSGPSPLLNGRQREAWRLLKTRLDLVDAFPLPRIFLGTRFTHRAVHGIRMDQSRLDRFYISGKGYWLHAILQLKHVQTQTLSDHNPIILTVQFAPTPAPLRATSRPLVEP